MLGLSTLAGKDAWLAALLDAFDSVRSRPVAVSARMIVDVERHLRDNARANAAGSQLFH